MTIPAAAVYDRIYIAVVACACLMGIPLNVYALYKLLRALRWRRTSTLLLSLNIVIGNIIVLVFDGVGSLVWRIVWSWQAGDVMCKFFCFTRPFGNQLTSNLVVAVAVDMCIALYFPLKAQSRIRKLLLISYGLAALLAFPQFLLWGTVTGEIPQLTLNASSLTNMTQCVFSYSRSPANTSAGLIRNLYTIYHITIIFWVPFVVLAPCYAAIFYQILKRASGRHVRTDAAEPLRRHTSAPMRHSRGVRQAVYVIALFLGSWLPYQILSIISLADKALILQHETMSWLYNARILNNIVNVAIYAFPACRRESERRSQTNLTKTYRSVCKSDGSSRGKARADRQQGSRTNINDHSRDGLETNV